MTNLYCQLRQLVVLRWLPVARKALSQVRGPVSTPVQQNRRAKKGARHRCICNVLFCQSLGLELYRCRQADRRVPMHTDDQQLIRVGTRCA